MNRVFFWAELVAVIEPHHLKASSLETLKELQLADQVGEEEIEFNFGEKQELFRENRRLIEVAIEVGALPLINGFIPREQLYAWLETKGLFDLSHMGIQTSNVIDVFLQSFLGDNYQDYTRLKLAILGAKRYATGEARTQPEVVAFLEEEMRIRPGESLDARQRIAYVSQPDTRTRPGRR